MNLPWNTPARTLLALSALLVLAAPAAAQIRIPEFKIHDRGELWDTMKDNGAIGAPNPTNRFEYFPSMDWPGGPHVLPDKDDQRSYNVGAGMWIGGRRADGSLFFNENGPFQYVDEGTFEPIVRIDNFNERPGFDPNEAEQRIIARWTTTAGLRVERTSRAWSFRGLNTFILLEYTVTNTSGGALSDVFVGFPYLIRPSYQDFVVHNGWGDDFNRADELVAYDEARRILYAWDDTPSFSLPHDVGNYWDEANEMRTPGYAGFALLEAPPASDARPQPANVLWAQILNNEPRLTLPSAGVQAMYALLTGADRSLQAAPEDRLSPIMLMSMGPYDMAPGQTLRFALVQAVNGLPLTEALRGLEVQPNLPVGRDSLFASIGRARVLHANGYRPASIPPPSPELTIIPEPSTRSVFIRWPAIDETWTHPDTGHRIREFRLYRSARAFIGPFTQVARVRVTNETDRTRFYLQGQNAWRFIDNSVTVGSAYFYTVTAIGDDGVESWLTNRNERPVRVVSDPAEDALNVRVFPNPFCLQSGFQTRGEENTIIWTNLPARATIRVYTAAGELVHVIEHDDPASGQAAWKQVTDSQQRLAPGIYFWSITSGVGQARGTLLLIK